MDEKHPKKHPLSMQNMQPLFHPGILPIFFKEQINLNLGLNSKFLFYINNINTLLIMGLAFLPFFCFLGFWVVFFFRVSFCHLFVGIVLFGGERGGVFFFLRVFFCFVFFMEKLF